MWTVLIREILPESLYVPAFALEIGLAPDRSRKLVDYPHGLIVPALGQVTLGESGQLPEYPDIRGDDNLHSRSLDLDRHIFPRMCLRPVNLGKGGGSHGPIVEGLEELRDR